MRLGALVVALCAATACGRIGYEMIDENDQPIGTSGGPGGAGGTLPVTTGSAGVGGATSSATAAGSTGVGTGSGGVGGATAGSTGVGAGGRATGGGAAGSTTGVGGASTGTSGAAGSSTAATGGAAGAGGAAGSGSTSATGGASGSGGAGGVGGSVGGGGSAGAADAGGPTCRSAVFNGHNYAFCDSPLAWAAARTDCNSRGMFMVRIDDQAEQDWVHSMIPAADQANNATALWRYMGGNDLTTAGDWQWDDGQSFWSGGKSGMAVNGAYTNWAPTEPSGTQNHCVTMQARLGTWYNLDCPTARPYVCEQY